MKKPKALQRWRTHVICMATGSLTVFVCEAVYVCVCLCFHGRMTEEKQKKQDRRGVDKYGSPLSARQEENKKIKTYVIS